MHILKSVSSRKTCRWKGSVAWFLQDQKYLKVYRNKNELKQMNKLGTKQAYGNCSIVCAQALNSFLQSNAFILISYNSKEPKEF